MIPYNSLNAYDAVRVTNVHRLGRIRENTLDLFTDKDTSYSILTIIVGVRGGIEELDDILHDELLLHV